MAARRARTGRVVVHRAGPLGRQVLIERPAERHVDDLDTTADAEDGNLALAGDGEQG